MDSQDDAEKAPDTLMNGITGGLAGIIPGFLPFSTAPGGAVSGYLEGGRRRDGPKAGAVAGLVCLIPVLFIIAAISVFSPVILAGGGGNVRAVTAMMLFILFASIYVFGFSMVGGVPGAYYREKVREG